MLVQEVYDECGSLCHPTCATYEDPPELCPAICVAGCYCADPLLRSAVCSFRISMLLMPGLTVLALSRTGRV